MITGGQMSVRGRSSWLVAVVLVALVAVACSDSSDGDAGSTKSSTSTSSTHASLDGTNWVLTSGSLTVPLGDVTVTAQFTKDAVSGDSGCNAYGAPITVDGSSITIGPNITSTLAACVGAEDSVETAYLSVLPKVRSFASSGKTLELRNANGDRLLRYRASGGADDVEGTWTVTSYYTGNAIESVVGGVELTAVFDAKSVSGSGGCNNFNGPVKITTSTIAIGPLASTLIGCSEPIATQEQQYLAALQLASTYAVSGDRLDLFRADGGFAVTLQRGG
ncbi:MAG TPA: META domain-containing protein [Acidimicrobiia bacterium]|nr:META domain-containing protein [Acidimicrobiia bacterium]